MVRRTLARGFAVVLVGLMGVLPMASAFAASPRQDVDPDLVGLWVSEVSEAGETVSISLFDDGSMQALSEFDDDSASMLYAGSWVVNDDDTVSLLIEEVDGEAVGDEPIEILYDQTDDGELNAPDTTDFGDDGMTLTYEDAEPIAFVDEMAGDTPADDTATEDTTAVDAGVLTPGVYVTDALDDGGVPVAAVVYINEDGTYHSSATTFDYESVPSVRLGTWVDNGDGSLTLTSEQEIVTNADGEAEVVDLDTPETLEFTVNGDVLEGDLNLYRIDAAAEMLTGFAGEVEAGMDDSASSESDMIMYMSPLDTIIAGTVNVLVMLPDGTASFTYGSTEGDTEPTVEVGEWTLDDDGVLTVDLTMDADGNDLDEPSTIVFEEDEDGNLVATDFDADRYGDEIVLEPTEGQQ